MATIAIEIQLTLLTSLAIHIFGVFYKYKLCLPVCTRTLLKNLVVQKCFDKQILLNRISPVKMEETFCEKIIEFI